MVEGTLELISDEAFIYKSVIYNDKIVLKKGSSALTDTEHKLLNCCMLNISHDIECEEFVIS